MGGLRSAKLHFSSAEIRVQTLFNVVLSKWDLVADVTAFEIIARFLILDVKCFFRGLLVILDGGFANGTEYLLGD